ncbi:hypothetical protein [Kocuria sp. CNJ-770]|nr:hypothetical protein [Kocuria sp. CNJ-770]
MDQSAPRTDEVPVPTAGPVLLIVTGIEAVRAPKAWAYLLALHTADRTG